MNQNAVDAILTLFLVMIMGFGLKKWGIINRSADEFIVQLLTRAAIPCLMLLNGYTQFTEEFLVTYYPAILAAFLSIMSSLILSQIIGRFSGIKESSQGVFSAMFAFSNTIFIGVPVVSGIFGDHAIPYLMLYYFMNTLLFWTVGVYLVGGDQGVRLLSWNSLRKVFNLAMVAFILGIVLMLNDVELPNPVTRSLGYLSVLVTPLASLYMGSIIADLSFKKFPGFKPTILILLGRFLISPMLTWGILTLFGFSGLLVQVLVITAALPVMMQITVLAGYYGKDKQYTAFMVALTTLLAIVVLPLYFQLI